MPTNWEHVYREVRSVVDTETEGESVLFYRGHSNSEWKLEPGIAREERYKDTNIEQNAYFSFVTKAGRLLPETADPSGWPTIFTMQHHGIPTRLLDWSETFSVALYFALKSATGDAAIWILNPYKLNDETIGKDHLIHPTDLDATYYQYYISKKNQLQSDVVAFSPLRHNQRVFNQRAGFTLHNDVLKPLEQLHPNVVHKVTIPDECHEEARQFLLLSGVSEYSLFPDLDGLAREINEEMF